MKRLFALFVAAMTVAAYADTETVDGIEWKFYTQDGKAILRNGWANVLPSSTKGAVTIPAELGGCPVTKIGDCAFQKCTGLTAVTVPEGVESIDESVFNGCTAMRTLTLPASLKRIGGSSFAHCDALETLEIPEGMIRIGGCAFSDCAGLKSVVIPKSVKTIAAGAFAGCTKLSSVTLPEGLEKIGGFAFYGCTSLTSVTLPASLRSIGLSAFQDCTALESAAVPEGVTYVGPDAFLGCPGQPVPEVLPPFEIGAVQAPTPKRIVLLAFDGLAGYTVDPDTMPNLYKLMQEGSWTLRSRSILPSSSSLNWHSLFTCSASEQHGYTEWGSEKPKFEILEKTERGLYPDIFYGLSKQKPEIAGRFIVEWGGMLYTVDTNACTEVVWDNDRTNTTAVTCAALEKKDAAFIATCYGDPDSTGHAWGWASEKYEEVLRAQDAKIGVVLAKIEELGLKDETIVIVTADHGGKPGIGHGGPTEFEMSRPFVVAGPGIKKNYRMKFAGTVYDDGATMAALLGLRPYRAWIGRPRVEIFE